MASIGIMLKLFRLKLFRYKEIENGDIKTDYRV